MSQTEVQLIKDAVIVNADVSNSAAIDVSKISGALPAAGGTITGDVTFTGANVNIVFDKSDNALEFGNDAKAKFGADTDLEIHHQSSDDTNLINSHKELKIYSNGNTSLNTNNADVMVKAIKNGAVELYHDNTKRIETTSSGATVTGDLITTGLYKSDTAGEGLHNTATGGKFFSNNSNDTHLEHGSNAQVKLSFIGMSSTYRGAVSADANAMHLLTGASGEQVAVKCIANGATELYHSGSKKIETTSVGVTTTGRVKLDVNSSTVFPTSFSAEAYTPYDHELVIDNNTGGNEGSFAGIFFHAGADSDGSKVGTARVTAVETGNYKADLVFSTRNTSFTQKMRIKADGRVLIGTTTAGESGADELTIENTSADNGITLRSSSSNSTNIFFSDGTSGASQYAGYIQYTHSADALQLGTASTRRIRIDSDGLKFGTATAAANALDEYEEGTWTPSQPGGTMTTNRASYVRVGRVVHWYLHCTLTSVTNDANQFQIHGLPYTSSNDTDYYGGTACINYTGDVNNSGVAALVPLVNRNTNNIYFHFVGIGDPNAPARSFFAAQLVNKTFMLNGLYFTDA